MKTHGAQFRRILILLGAAVASLSAPLCGARYHVAPDGKADGDGSREKPFDIGHVLKAVKLQPGDEVIFLDGVYRVAAEGRSALTIRTAGTEQAPIVFRAEHRHKAVIDGGTPIAGWKKSPRDDGVWECRVGRAVRHLLVNGEALLNAGSRWRRDGRKTLDEGMFVCERLQGGGVLLKIRPWARAEPKEAYAVAGTLVSIGGAYTIVDGLLIRRGATGVHVGGRLVHTYRHQAGIYRDLAGLVHNTYGSFNILRNCIVRDMCGSALTSNESRFNLIEDNVIYNAGIGQGSHGIYVSQGAENLTLRRNIWWRTSGGAIHIYSGSGIDSPRNVVVERNIFGPDKRNRCFPIRNRKSCALYVWGGKRWAGGNRIVHNIVIGPHDRAISLHRCHFNLIANNTFLNSDGAPVQIGSGFGNLVVNNILEYSPGGEEKGVQRRPAGYVSFLDVEKGTRLSRFRNNLLLRREIGGRDTGARRPPPLRRPVSRPPISHMEKSKLAGGDPFVNRADLDFRLKPGCAAVDMGVPVPHVTAKSHGAAPDVGALELGEEIYGEKGKFPAIPKWLLAEWPLSKRGQ